MSPLERPLGFTSSSRRTVLLCSYAIALELFGFAGGDELFGGEFDSVVAWVAFVYDMVEVIFFLTAREIQIEPAT